VVLAFAFVSTYPPGVLFALFLAYALSGYAVLAWNWRRRRQSIAEEPALPPQDEPQEPS
jgi:CDP-diacylglycerol--serine O-phosphatidyltransferase